MIKNINRMSSEKKQELVTIYTWGNKKHKKCPVKTEHDFNVAGITNYKPRGINLKKETGRHPKIQAHVQRQSKYHLYFNTFIKMICKPGGLRTISIYCHKGRHRSVATAILLGNCLVEKGYKVEIKHLDS